MYVFTYIRTYVRMCTYVGQNSSTLSQDICLEILKCRITHCSLSITEVVALGPVTERINGDTMWSVFL